MRVSSSPLVFALLVTGAGCGDASFFAPDPAADVLPAAARVGSDVVTPMSAELTVVWNVDQSADALTACAPRPGLAVGSGNGHGTQLGAFRVGRMDHCSIDLGTAPPALDGNGVFELLASDGSTLHGRYAFLLLPPGAGGFADLTIEGGTGRFEGAEGVLDVVDGLEDLSCADALCLTDATMTARLSGFVAVPRPSAAGNVSN